MVTGSGRSNTNTGKRMTKRDLVVTGLRSMIASGELARGARVQQDELAARFNTSITPVREALRQLEAEGLLVGEPHRGVRVLDASVDEQYGVYISRRLLEPFAVQLAANRMSRRDLASARALVKVMDEAGKRGDLSGVRNANRDFHFLLYSHCEIPSLVRIIENVWLSFPWDTLEVLDPRASRSAREHEEVLDCIGRGDMTAAGAAIERHLHRSYVALVQHLTGEPPASDPFDEIQDAD